MCLKKRSSQWLCKHSAPTRREVCAAPIVVLPGDRLLSADLICGGRQGPGAAENKVHRQNRDADDATRQRPTWVVRQLSNPSSNGAASCRSSALGAYWSNRAEPQDGRVNSGSVSDSRPHKLVGSVFGAQMTRFEKATYFRCVGGPSRQIRSMKPRGAGRCILLKR